PAEENADVAEKTPHAADGLRHIEVELVARPVLDHNGCGQIGREKIAHRDRTASGTAAAVWAGKCFVDVIVLHICAEVARARDAENGIHVRAIKIYERAFTM